MLRTICLFLFLAPLLLSGCKPADDDEQTVFYIDGLRAVDFGAVGGSAFTYSVGLSSGSEEVITLSVSDLPAGVTADISKSSGLPPFTGIMTFNLGAGATPGTYTIRVTGTSASYTKTYPLTLTIPQLNGYFINTQFFRATGFVKNTISGYTVYSAASNDGGGSIFNANVNSSAPTADGAYTYYLYNSPDAAKNMEVVINIPGFADDFKPTGTDMRTATLTVRGGKFSLAFPATAFSNGTEARTVTAMLSE